MLRLQSGPLRLATCNLHGLQTEQGVTALVKEVRVRQYITSNFPLRDEIQWTLFLGVMLGELGLGWGSNANCEIIRTSVKVYEAAISCPTLLQRL